ncbi:NAD-dependent epimerase/dehydratase family protein [Pedobacter sp. MC2016-14]|uniref:NAD-dependent epimerase/dehydratase family protein n=1 Tax=Pedobacter sp. MC2016-14 TaxID=2897327 RepID=UPI001E3BA9EF|nr:NAD-dependent epimerase/dehydratase family protein [Pedobacter sp. MC2016-14]MCD0486884.1 NAD-dependent epimerase/dehydratase family protein [Pedobacter sp. MC2016-14]
MKIAVTGSTGFVGQNLTLYLKRFGIEIQVISRAELQHPDASLFEGCDALIHLAAKAHDLKRVSNPEEYEAVNYVLTKKLYDAFLFSKASKFIFLSSVKAAADTLSGVLKEDSLPKPQTAYGKSKLKAETYLAAQNLAEGKSLYILRPCMIHGPGNKGNLNLLYQFVKKGIPWPLAAFDNKRSFLSVENLCFVIKEILNHPHIPSGIYNVADDEALSTSTVVSILAASLQQEPKLWFLPKGLVCKLAKLGDTLRLPLNTERLTKLTESYVADNSKIKQVLQQDLPLSAREGLKLTANSFHNLKHK